MTRLMNSMWGSTVNDAEALQVPSVRDIARIVGVDELEVRRSTDDEVQFVGRSRPRRGPTTLITFGVMPTAYFDRLPLVLTQCPGLPGADVFGRVVYYVEGERTYLVRSVSENHPSREAAVRLDAELMRLWRGLQTPAEV